MTEAADVAKARRARQVADAVHSLRMEGLELAPVDAADAADYVAGRLSLEEYGQRTRDRYGVPDSAIGGSASSKLNVRGEGQ